MDTSSRQLHLQGEGRTGGRSSEVTEWHGPTRTPRVQVRYGVCVWKYIYIYIYELQVKLCPRESMMRTDKLVSCHSSHMII